MKDVREKKSSFFSNLTKGISDLMGGKKKQNAVEEKNDMIDEDKKARELLAGVTKPATPGATRMMMKDNFDELVTSLTKDPIPYLRKYAALRLGELGDKKAIEYLLAGIRDENIEVRMASAQALGKLADESLVEKMIETLKDSNDYLREQTIQVLSSMGELSVPPLIRSLKSHNWMLPYCAVRALGLIKDKRSIKALIDLVEDDSNVYVQKAAIDALEKMGKEGEEELSAGLSHESGYVREKIAQIMAKSGSKDCIDRLQEAIDRESDNRTKDRMTECLKKLEVRFNISRE